MPARARTGARRPGPVGRLGAGAARARRGGRGERRGGATGVLQETVSDEVRATVLGINDSVIIAAALVGSLVAPMAVELLGGALLMGGLGAVVLLVAWWARPQHTTAASQAHRAGARYRAQLPV